MLLYGRRARRAQAMIALLPADKQAAARARMALRANADNANDAGRRPAAGEAQSARAWPSSGPSYLRQRNLDSLALALVAATSPSAWPTTEIADDIWTRAPAADQRRAAGTATCSAAYAGRGQHRPAAGRRPAPRRSSTPAGSRCAKLQRRRQRRPPLRAHRARPAPRRSPRAARSTGAAAPPRPRATTIAAPGLLRPGGAVQHHLLRPAGRREGGPAHPDPGPRPAVRPRRTARASRAASMVRAIRLLDRRRRDATCSASSCCASTTSCPTPRNTPCWSTWRAATATRISSMQVVRGGGPARLRPARARLSDRARLPSIGARRAGLRARHHPPGERASTPASAPAPARAA